MFHPVSRAEEQLPVVLSSNCYASDALMGIDMKATNTDANIAAERYGYSRIGLSSPDGYWTFGNDGIVNDENPMPCSEDDSKDIPYLQTIFDFIDSKSDQFDNEKIYAEGFSQNSMFSAYVAFCFSDKVIGVWQGGSGMALNGELPDLPGLQAQCTASGYAELGRACLTTDVCDDCQYWPIYPCYNEARPMVDCVAEYTNDGVSVQDGYSSAVYMYDALVAEGHDVRLLRFEPSEDDTIGGAHKDPKNAVYWQVGCLGITSPCSEECETAFGECVDSQNASTAADQANAFSDCIDEPTFSSLEGCTTDCAPTYGMLILSETPVTDAPDNFGAATEDHGSRPTTSLCEV